MIVIRRRVGECVAVGDDLRVYVAEIRPDVVELELRDFGRDTKETLGLSVGESHWLPHLGVRLCNISIAVGLPPCMRLGVEAPREMPIHRLEVYEAIQRENLRSSRLEP